MIREHLYGDVNIEHIISNGYYNLSKTIINNSDVYHKLKTISIYGHLRLLELYINLNTSYEYDSLIVFAAQYGNDNIIEYLLSRGVDLYARGRSAVVRAINGGYFKAFKLLVDAGAIVGSIDNNIITNSALYGRHKIIIYLLQQDTYISQLNKDILFLVIKYNMINVLKYLLREIRWSRRHIDSARAQATVYDNETIITMLSEYYKSNYKFYD
jgi:hypothetical protein